MSKSKRGREKYEKTSHYWPVELQPFLVAVACVEVVLKNSEKASLIYREAKEAWGRQDCQTALNEVKIPFSRMLEALEAVRKNKILDWSDPLDEVYKRFLASQRKLADLKERLEDECTDNNWNELVKLWKRLDEEDKDDKDDKYYTKMLESQRKLTNFKEKVYIEDDRINNNWDELVKLWKRLDEEDKKDMR